MSAEFIGGQPGNFDYQLWQVVEWCNDWAVVYGLTDAGNQAYPFPWLLGFIRSDDAERNFVELLALGASQFDAGFYCTMGSVVGDWPLAEAALPANEFGEFNFGWAENEEEDGDEEQDENEDEEDDDATEDSS
jgi:hypothetical protein